MALRRAMAQSQGIPLSSSAASVLRWLLVAPIPALWESPKEGEMKGSALGKRAVSTQRKKASEGFSLAFSFLLNLS